MIGTPLTAMKGDRCGTPPSFDILTPTLRESAARLAERARAENWSHEEYLAACLQREVSARESHGEEGRIRAAGFPARKSLEEFDFDQSAPPTKPLAVGAKVLGDDVVAAANQHPRGSIST